MIAFRAEAALGGWPRIRRDGGRTRSIAASVASWVARWEVARHLSQLHSLADSRSGAERGRLGASPAPRRSSRSLRCDGGSPASGTFLSTDAFGARPPRPWRRARTVASAARLPHPARHRSPRPPLHACPVRAGPAGRHALPRGRAATRESAGRRVGTMRRYSPEHDATRRTGVRAVGVVFHDAPHGAGAVGPRNNGASRRERIRPAVARSPRNSLGECARTGIGGGTICERAPEGAAGVTSMASGESSRCWPPMVKLNVNAPDPLSRCSSRCVAWSASSTSDTSVARGVTLGGVGSAQRCHSRRPLVPRTGHRGGADSTRGGAARTPRVASAASAAGPIRGKMGDPLPPSPRGALLATRTSERAVPLRVSSARQAAP